MSLEDLVIRRAVEDSKQPGAQRKWLVDGKGLSLCITPPNRKTPTGSAKWVLRYRSPEDGKQRDMELGLYPKLSLAGARKALEQRRADIARKIDPVLQGRRDQASVRQKQQTEQAEMFARQMAAEAEADRLRAEQARLNARMTVRDLFERWNEHELAQRKDKGAETRRAFDKDIFPLIGDVPIEDVRRARLMEALDKIVARGSKRMANRVLSDLRQMFDYAYMRELIEVDPVAKIKKSAVGGRDNERDRVLSDEEIRLLAERVPVDGTSHIAGAARLELPTQVAIWLVASTLSRIGALSQMRWQDINFEKREWVIPDNTAKKELGYTVFLSEFAVRQLRRLQQPRVYAKLGEIDATDPVWVFPATRKEGAVCDKTIQKQISDRQKATGLKNRTKLSDSLCLPGGKWTSHDLRRTGASLMRTLGVYDDVVNRCLGHIESDKIKRIYIRSSLEDERRAAFDHLGERLEILTRSAESNVVPFPLCTKATRSAS